tara:strand:+ start:2013 stop:2972 length:960 start_codon:yes stop_codon:yes gene_type:complete
MLLIVSNKTDLATDFLILKLQETGVKYYRLNTEDYLTIWDFEWQCNDGVVKLMISENGSFLDINLIESAYIRQPRLPESKVEESEVEFYKREVGEGLRTLWRSIPDHKWLNPPYKILRASNKPEQISKAISIGFKVPNTCITSNSKVADHFYNNNNEDIVVKAVKNGFLFDGEAARIAPTRKILKEEIFALDDYEKMPLIFQKRIEKEYDIRVTVVGSKVFSTAILSQEYLETSTDWRVSSHLGLELKHEKITLPLSLEKMCVQLTRENGLRYSAIDLILSTNGEYYFLEINPNGQWAWIESLAGYPIRDSIISELVAV